MATEYVLPGNYSFDGIISVPFSVSASGAYNVKGKITLPTLTTSDTLSSLIVSVDVNGGIPFYITSGVNGGFETGSFLQLGDILNVVYTSSASGDTELNTIKSVISFY